MTAVDLVESPRAGATTSEVLRWLDVKRRVDEALHRGVCSREQGGGVSMLYATHPRLWSFVSAIVFSHEGDKILAFALLAHDGPAKLHLLLVCSDERLGGSARPVIIAALQYARSLRKTHATLDAVASAAEYYPRFGFKHVYGNGEHEESNLYHVKNLSDPVNWHPRRSVSPATPSLPSPRRPMARSPSPASRSPSPPPVQSWSPLSWFTSPRRVRYPS